MRNPVSSIFLGAVLIGAVLIATPTLGPAQENGAEPAAPDPAPPPCSAPEYSQFDFWVGEWNVAWEGGTGTNTVTREYDNCVIRERFEAGGFRGTSYSAYSKKLGRWQQTWVDNSGSYMDFEGGVAGEQGERMVLSREVADNDDVTHQRMTFYDIRPESLTWDWEKSADGGKTWELAWRLHYTKREPAAE